MVDEPVVTFNLRGITDYKVTTKHTVAYKAPKKT